MTSTNQQQRIAQLMKDQGWRGVLTIFLATRYRGDARIWRHVNLSAGTIMWADMLTGECFSSGETLMVRAACALYSSYMPIEAPDGAELNAAEVSLWSLAARLDDENFTLVLRALAAAGNRPVPGVLELR